MNKKGSSSTSQQDIAKKAQEAADTAAKKVQEAADTANEGLFVAIGIDKIAYTNTKLQQNGWVKTGNSKYNWLTKLQNGTILKIDDNGKTFTSPTFTDTGPWAERDVKEAIEKAEKNNQHVLILSAGMAQRSFSIPEITELYLAYDTGDNGATIQKMSRTLTPHKEGKIGRIISLSFDPNRDDKFDAMVIETAQNYKKNHNIKDLKQAMRDVLRTIDIFKCQSEGSVKIEVDEYLEAALARKSIDRVIGKIAPITTLTADEVRALASGNVDVFRSARQTAAARGKTHLNVVKQNKGANRIDANETDLKKAREMIVTISQNIDIIRYYGGSTIDEAFELMDADGSDIQDEVTDQFGVDYNLVKELVLSNFINRDLLDLKFS